MAVVAVVGRPNVGKSTLFNKLAGQRLSIVDNVPGVTRDRLHASCTWLDHTFTLIDTGGIEPDTGDVILSKIREQAQLAIDGADVVLLICDITTGVTATDEAVAHMLRHSNKPVIVCVNKCDSVGAEPPEFYEFFNLGFEDVFAVSAVHGHGTGDMLDRVCELLPEENEEEESDRIKVAIIGKPNVGKSSLLNCILGKERSIVSNVAGTTRDAIDAFYENEHGKYMLIDTAGLRRKSKVDENIEKYSVLRSYMAVERADVVLVLIDAREGVTEQDTKIAGYADDLGKACVVVANKWDDVDKETGTMEKRRKEIQGRLSFMDYAPIEFISAKTSQRVNKLFPLINAVNAQNCMRIPTGRLNSMLADAVTKVQPPSDKGRRLRLYYITQASVRPPTFVVFCNDKRLFHFSYKRYIENCIRETFGLTGTPIRILVRERDEKENR